MCGGQHVQKELISDLNYICLLIDAIGCGGGSKQENGGVIWIALDCLWRIIYILHEGSNQCKPQHALLSYAEEKIEEFGGMEMCNSHLFHSEQQENIRLIAGWTQQQLVILLETGKKEAEERARIAEEKATRLQIEKETQFQNLIHQP
ncbi:MAG: hypothetical protein EZS28_028048, partial [Streblomastix strix]